MGRLTPQQLLIISFACAIVLGTIALSLPVAAEGPDRLSLIDSLFTATSATCVTGLTVRDTAGYFSPFGETVILLLVQAGGLGIMTFSMLFAVMLGRKIGLTQSDLIQSTLDGRGVIGFKKLLLYILAIAAAIESVGALCLFLRFKAVMGLPFWETLWNAIFHAISAFCNAGFSRFSNSLTSFAADPYVNLTMMGLIFLGGIGFVVIMDVLGLFYKKGPLKTLSLQSKLALLVSVILITAGAIMLWFFEKDHLMRAMTWPQRIWGSLFQSVTTRTAGFNTIPIREFTTPSLMMMIFLMFIGASPGSTGGGIKTCTFAVIALAIYSMFMKRRRVKSFNRSIPQRVIRESLVIFFLALCWIFAATMILAYTEGKNGTFTKALFEIVSAFGTVGLSTGITSELSSVSKLVVIITMFMGRVGPLTMALAVAFKERRDEYTLPEENVMVG